MRRPFFFLILTCVLLPLQLIADRTEEKHHEYGTMKDRPGEGYLGGKANWLCQMGPTGARAILKKRAFLVKEVWAGGPAEKAGLKVDDLVVAANGKEFSTFYFLKKEAPSPDFHGYEGPMMDLGNAIEDSEGGDGKLVLTVKRKSQTLDITVQLEVLGRFSDTWPYNCEKSKKLLDKAVNSLSSIKGGGHIKYVVGLSYLASGKFASAKSLAMTTYTKPIQGGWTWHVAYGLIFLTEYHALTGDDSVIPNIKHCVDRLIAMQDREKRVGGWGHNAQPAGYLSMSFPSHMALIGLCNAYQIYKLDVDKKELKKTIELGFKVCETGTFANGGVHYGVGYKDFSKGTSWGVPGKSGAMVAARRMGMQCEVGGVERHKHYFDMGPTFFKNPAVIRKLGDTHGDGALGVFWTLVGSMIIKDDQTLRTMIDYNKAYFNLSRTQDGLLQTIIGRDSKDHGYWKSGKYAQCTAGWVLLLSLPSAKLKLQGTDLFINGVEKGELNKKLYQAFVLLEGKKFNQAEQLIRPFASKTKEYQEASPNQAVADKQQKYADIMMEYVMQHAQPVIDKLVPIADAGDVCLLQDKLKVYNIQYAGIPTYDAKRVAWEEKFTVEPWLTELKVGRALEKEKLKRHSAKTWPAYLKKIQAIADKHPDSFYKDKADEEMIWAQAAVQKTIDQINKIKESGDVYMMNEQVKFDTKKCKGVASFDKAVLEWKEFFKLPEVKKELGTGKAYYKNIADAAKAVDKLKKAKRKPKKNPVEVFGNRMLRMSERYPESPYGKAAKASYDDFVANGKTAVNNIYFAK